MDTQRSLRIFGVVLLLAGGQVACDKPGPAETAGKKIDQTADAAGKSLGDAANKMGDKMNEQSANAGLAMDDAEITAKVKAAIFAEPGLRTLQISVNTVKGIVTLSGSVDTKANRDRAKTLAAAVAGVAGVENALVPAS